jgi:hypothetical protein
MVTSEQWFKLDNRRGPIWGSRGRESNFASPVTSRDHGFRAAVLCQSEVALSFLNPGNGYAEFVREREDLNVDIDGKGT